MEGSMIDLSKYRFQSAKEELETARLLMVDSKLLLIALIMLFFMVFVPSQLWQNLILVNIRE
jgi:hypothetical protein